jgi:hypothetical protein
MKNQNIFKQKIELIIFVCGPYWTLSWATCCATDRKEGKIQYFYEK